MAISDVFNVANPDVYTQNTQMVAQAVQAYADRKSKEHQTNMQNASNENIAILEAQTKDKALKQDQSQYDQSQQMRARAMATQEDQFQKNYDFDQYKFNASNAIDLRRMGLDESKFNSSQADKARKLLMDKQLQEAAKGGISGIRDYLLSQGNAKGALELDQAQQTLQNGVLNGQKSLMDLQRGAEQDRAGKLFRQLSVASANIMGIKDPGLREDATKQAAQLLYDADPTLDLRGLSSPTLQVAIPHFTNMLAQQSKLATFKPEEYRDYIMGMSMANPGNKDLKAQADALGGSRGGTNISVDPSTGAINVQTGQGLQRSTTASLEKDVANDKQLLSQLDYAESKIDPRIFDRVHAAKMDLLAEKQKIAPNSLSEQQKKDLTSYTQGLIPMKQYMLKFGKEITGVAGSEAMFQKIYDSTINPGQSYTEFQAAVGSLRDILQTGIKANQSSINEGVSNQESASKIYDINQLQSVVRNMLSAGEVDKAKAYNDYIDQLIKEGRAK